MGPSLSRPAFEDDLIAAIRAVRANFNRVETVSAVKISDRFERCMLVWVTSYPINDIVQPTHSLASGGAGQLSI